MKKLTLQDIADAAHVSCATVSRCLSGSEGVGEKTRARVLQLCREMGYMPNFAESGTHRSGRIGLLLPRLAGQWAELAAQLEQYLASLGYVLLIAQSSSRQQEQEALQRLIAHRVDGVIVIPGSKDSRRLLRGQKGNIQGVFLDAYLGDLPESYVAVDHFMGGQAAVRYLHSCGCKRILFVGREESEISNKRQGGAASAFRQLQLEGNCLDVKDLTQVKIEEFDGIIAADCSIALQLPQKQNLVSFDGQDMARAGISINTFDAPDNMAKIAADILMEKLDRTVGGYSHRMVLPQLQLRKEGVGNG